MEPCKEDLDQAISSSPEALLLCDSDGRIIGANDPACRLMGYERGDLLSRRLEDLADPAEPEGDGALLPALRREAPVTLETAVRCKDGRPVRLHLSLHPLRMGERTHSVIRIARRRRAADRLPEEPAFIRAVLGAPGTLVLSTTRDGKICFASAAFQDQTGLDFAQLRGSRIWELLRDAHERAALREAVERPDPTRGVTLTWPTAEGGRRTSVWSSALVKAIPPAPEFVLLMGRDAAKTKRSSGRRELEKRVVELSAELDTIRCEQEAFTNALAHDLRAPLRAMSGFSDTLLEDYAGQPLDSKGRGYASRIIEAARRMDKLIEDLLVYNRLSHTPVCLEPVQLGSIVADLLDAFSRERDDREAAINADFEPVEVVADAALLYRVLGHLLSNALKFVPPGVAPRATLRAARQGERVRIEIEDNGIGIAPEHIPRIFGVFQRLNKTEAYEGTGMGLAIVRRAMDRMGGRVDVISEPGKGSRFWIELLSASE